MTTNYRFWAFIIICVLFISQFPAYASNIIADNSDNSSHPFQGQGDQPTPTPTTEPVLPEARIVSAEGSASFTLREFGTKDFSLRFPSDHVDIVLQVPYRWQIIPGENNSYFDLKYDMVYQGPQSSLADLGQAEAAVIDVYVENVLAISYTQSPGINQIVRVPFPAEAVENHQNNRYTISIDYNSGGNCEVNNSANLIVHDDSRVHLSFNLSPVDLQISSFPLPLVNDSFLPDRVLIILPDEFTETELSVAAKVAWVMGERARSNVSLQIVTASQVIADGLTDISAVVVGTPNNNLFLKQLYDRNILSMQFDTETGAISAPNLQISSGDGVLQLVQSDIDDQTFYLVLTSDSDEGFLRAASSLSSASLLFALDSNLAAIGKAKSVEQALPSQEGIISFAELGMSDIEQMGIGEASDSFSIFIPANWVFTSNPTLELDYFNSSRLNPSSSIITVELNGNRIGDAAIDPKLQANHTIIEIPSETILLGSDNEFSFNVVADVTGECVPHNTPAAWLRLLSSSVLRLPFSTVENDSNSSFNNPMSYLFRPQNEATVLLVLPSTPSVDNLENILKLGRLIGSERGGESNIEVIYDYQFDPSDYSDYDILVVGQITTNTLIASLNDKLPQPFLEDGSGITQVAEQTAYQVPSNLSLGLIEVITSPWNPERGITIVSGTTLEGLGWSIQAILDPKLIGSLRSDINFVRYDIIESLNSREFTPSTLSVASQDLLSQPEILATRIPTVTTVATETSGTTIVSNRTPIATVVTATVIPSITPSPTVIIAEKLPDKYQPLTQEASKESQSIMIFLMIGGLLLLGLGLIYNVAKLLRNP
jgi:Bacterial cellulose synthase subunit